MKERILQLSINVMIIHHENKNNFSFFIIWNLDEEAVDQSVKIEKTFISGRVLDGGMLAV